MSLEFLPGRFLRNYLTSLQIEEEAQEALHSLGYDLEDIEEEEWDAGLGNGGLGRLASCFLDSWPPCSSRPTATESVTITAFSTNISSMAPSTSNPTIG